MDGTSHVRRGLQQRGGATGPAVRGGGGAGHPAPMEGVAPPKKQRKLGNLLRKSVNNCEYRVYSCFETGDLQNLGCELQLEL